MKIRYKLSLLLIGLMLIGCLFVTQSYALWIITEEQTGSNEMEVGCFSIGFTEQSESIKLDNTYPVNDSIGLSSNPYTFTIKNTCTINNNYVLTLNTINTNTLDVNNIKYALYKSTEAKPEVGSKLSRINNDLENLSVENLGTSYILDTGVLSGGTKEDGVVSGGEEVTYNLYLWIDESAGNEVEGQVFEASINVINTAMESSKMPADEYIKRISIVENGDGLYKVPHEVSEISSDWNKEEYRYAGVNPNNYVSFNNEIWQIIGLVNVKTENGIEQRVKIIRKDEIDGQKDFGNYAWDYGSTPNWTKSSLKNMLNDSYYNSSIGNCYIDGTKESQCDFNSGIDLPKGLDETARNMVDKDIAWNIGGFNTYNNILLKTFYEQERGNNTSPGYPSEWSSTTDEEGNFNGIGLIYPSDYGYATNGGSIGREQCFDKILFEWNNDNITYKNECVETDWLKVNKNYAWTISPRILSSYAAFYLYVDGYISGSIGVDRVYEIWPTLYLKSSVKIIENPQSNLEYGTIDNPFVLEA